MKKRLIYLSVILSLTKAGYSQSCLSGPLRPSATVSTNYAVNIAAVNGYTDAGNFIWYVSTSPDINSGQEIPATGSVISVGTGLIYGKANSAPGQKNISLTWSADAVAFATSNPYYLFVKYRQTIGTCGASNIKVWKIIPINNFQLAIEAVDISGSSSTGNYCAPDITNIDINGDHATYTYGENAFFSKVTASNITGEWTPSVRIPTLNPGQTIKELGWSTTINGTFTGFVGAANSTGGEFTSSTNAIAASDGSLSIFVKLVISNGSWEGLTDQNIVIGIDGTYSSSALKDVKSNMDCTEEISFGKTVTQSIKARPVIISDTPSGNPSSVPTPPSTNFMIP